MTYSIGAEKRKSARIASTSGDVTFMSPLRHLCQWGGFRGERRSEPRTRLFSECVSHSKLHRARCADTGQSVELGARALVEGVAKIVSIREVVQLPVDAKPA